jgi:hypothetical protein
VKLARQAQAHVDALAGRIPSAGELTRITESEGIDLATMVFYQAVRNAEHNRAFVDGVDGQQINEYENTGVTLLIIPALFYREHPEVGGDGAHIAEVARSCGIDARVVPTHSKGGVDKNTPIILDALRNVKEGPIWVMTLSKGASEWRYVLQQHRDEIPLHRVTTWFNVGGLPNGCHVVDAMLSSPLRRMRTRALLKLLGMDYDTFPEFGTGNPHWKKPLHLPEHLRVINVVGAPLTSHVQKALHSRFLMLKKLGPNDGMVLLPEALWLPGYVYPVLGADHFFRGSQISPLLYRLFAWVLETSDNGPISIDTEEERFQRGMQ